MGTPARLTLRRGAARQPLLGQIPRLLMPPVIGMGLLGGCAPEPRKMVERTFTSRSTVDAAQLDAAARDAVVELNLPGLAIAIIDNGEPIWGGGYGIANVVTEAPVDLHTPFMLASVSKTVVAAALAQAHAEGFLDLDGTVRVQTGLPLDNPQADGAITRRHLATHTAGIDDNWAVLADNYVLGDSPIALGELIEGYFLPGGAWYDPAANFLPLSPGTSREYSNMGTALAAWALEPTTGLSLDEWCEQRLFPDLGMLDAGWHLADHDVQGLAMPHGDNGNGGFFPYGHYGYPDWPDGQLRASVTDMARSLAAVARGARGLDEGARQELLTVPFPEASTRQGFFWYLRERDGRQVWTHSGEDAGVATELIFDPETGDGVVILTNVDWTGERKAGLRALEALAMDLVSDTPPPP